MLNPQFLQVWECRSLERVNVRPAKFRTVPFKQADSGGYTLSLDVAQPDIPFDELVADFDFPSHGFNIPSR
jgi:hypothetical protein